MRTDEIKKRYFRVVSGAPEGAVTHHADCHYYRVHICTCGLLHDLMIMPSSAEDLFSHYPKQMAYHENAIEALFSLRERGARSE